MEKVKIEFTLDEINKLIEALGKQPFIEVYKLIEKLHVETKKQMEK